MMVIYISDVIRSLPIPTLMVGLVLICVNCTFMVPLDLFLDIKVLANRDRVRKQFQWGHYKRIRGKFFPKRRM